MITPGDRSDVVLAVMSAHAAEGFPSLSTVILNGGLPLHPSIAALVDGLGLQLPIIATGLGTFDTASAVASARGRVTATSQRKIDTALALMERHVDTADLLARLAIPIPTVITPQMFEYQLLERARADRKRIVLPEGDDDRILKAAGRLLQREVADLTILGDETAVRARAAELGVDLVGGHRAQPATSRAVRSVRRAVRASCASKKGVTVEQARETIHDVSYFGTMLVHNDMVDGMVSGAAHTTAHTVRPGVRDHQDPARRVDGVEHLPDVPGRPGTGLRRLRDRPRPDRRATRRHRDQFGAHRRTVRHRPAGGHAVVLHRQLGDRCRCRQGPHRNRIWCVSGNPICWSRDPSSTTRPSNRRWRSPRCRTRRWPGRATVLIFPDLNTGNNTYKAVQRSAGAVAIGPGAAGAATSPSTTCPGARWSPISSTPWRSRRSRRRGASRATYRPGAQLGLVVAEIQSGANRIRGCRWRTASSSGSVASSRLPPSATADRSCAARPGWPITTPRCA